MKKLLHIPTLLLLFAFYVLSPILLNAASENGFIKNLGQIQDQNSKPNTSVLYLMQTGNFKVHLRNNGFSYEVLSPTVFQNSAELLKNKSAQNRKSLLYQSHRIDFDFVKGRPTEIVESNPSELILNYFADNKQITNVPVFKKILYKNVWENIDIEFIINEKDVKNPFKYNFILHPGAVKEYIQLEVKGTDIQKNKDGSIFLPNTYGDIKEVIPSSYLENNKREREEVPISFATSGNIIRFQLDVPMSLNGTLVIDPNPIRLWSSYIGGLDIDIVQGVGVDSIGNMAFGGLTISSNNIATIGTYQISMSNIGVPSGFVIKTNPNGMKTWGTYINGNDFTLVSKVEIDKTGAIIAFGETSSTTNIASTGAFQLNNNSPDSYDAFIMKFNGANGQRVWGSYLGGAGEDSAYDLTVDGSNNIYVGGQTYSGDLFVQTNGAFNSVFHGASDGYLTKISSGGAKLWSTFIGGGNADAIVGVKMDKKGNLYIGGNTTSSDSIGTLGTHKPTITSNYDCFLMKINPTNGTRIWGTYYGGIEDDEMGAFAVDTSGNIALCGQTYSRSGIATFCTEQGKAPDYTTSSSASFVAKFIGNTGTIDFGTYFGKQISTIRSVVVDVKNNVFVGGETSESSMATTGSFQSTLNNGQDAYLAKINPQGLQEWCTFIGGDGDGDFLTALKVHGNNNIIAAGYTNSAVGLASGGTQLTFSGIIDGWVAKFQDTSKNVRVKYSITANSTVLQGSCINSSNGQAIATGTGGVSPYSFEWNNSITTNTNNNLPPGAYSVTVYDAKGCGAEFKGTMPSIPLPVPNLGPDRGVCLGSSTTIKASGGGTYLWSTGEKTDSIVVNPTVITNYYVTVTNSFGCVNRDTIRITINQLPVANSGVDKTTCVGKPVSLTATGGGTYRWSTGQTTAIISVTPTITTSYIVTVTSQQGCSAKDTVIVNVDTLPIPQTPTTISYCTGSLATITAVGGGNYLWSNGSTQPFITVEPKTTTNYTVTVTNSKGCSQTAVTTVIPVALPVANAGQNQSICIGQKTTLNATGGGSYFWSTGETTATISVNPTQSTAYIVTVTNLTGCFGIDTVMVNIKQLPTYTTSGNTVICEGTNTTLNVTTQGANSIKWSTGQIGNSISVNPKTPTTYSITVTNSNTGCSAYDSILVSINPKPVVKASPDIAICLGKSTLLQVGNGVKYEWSDGQTGTSITVTPTITTLYTVTVTDKNGCTNTTQTLVTIIPPPSINISPDITICPGGNVVLQAGGGSTYLWSNGNTDNFINVKPSQTTTYSVTVTNQSGCSAIASSTVTIGATLNASAGTDKAICKGQVTTLTASGGSKYIWNTGDTTSKIFVAPTSTTTYTVTVSIGGCTATASVVVNVNDLPVAALGKDTTICVGSKVTLNSNTTNKVLWSTGETSQDISVTPSKSTLYSITVTNSNNCSSTDTVLVMVVPLPNANAGNDVRLCEGKSIGLTATGGIGFVWNTGEKQQTITIKPTSSQIYYVTVTDMNGCSAKDSVKVTVVPPPTVNLGNDTLKVLIGKSATLDAGIGNGYKYKWSSGQTTQTITFDTPTGEYCVTVTNADGCTTTDCIYVKFIPNAIFELENPSVKVYPNPTLDNLFIEAIEGNIPNAIQIETIDGKLILKQSIENQTKTIIPVEHLPSGVYLLKLKEENRVLFFRFIKE